jgi:hypothetical protein
MEREGEARGLVKAPAPEVFLGSAAEGSDQ